MGHPSLFFFLPLVLQVGTFTTQDGEYFMEPLMGAEGEPYADEHNKPHLVYRRRTNREGPPVEPCAASGNRLQTE